MTFEEATRSLEAAIGPLPRGSAAIREIEDRAQIATYAKLPSAVVRGEGAWVETAEGERYLDLYGGHAVALTGHNHPRVVQAIRAQAERLLFYSNLVYNDVRAAAVERLAGLAPDGLGHVFLCNSGAEANEAAIKIARKHTGRMQIVSMRDGFHGRTLGALGATGMASYRDPAYPLPDAHAFIPYGDEAALEGAINGDVAAVLLEPIPSMGGIRVADEAWFRALRSACTASGALLIFDEVQTGFGRTGERFFGAHVGVTPDLISGAKGIASGVPAGVVFVHDAIADGIGLGEQGTTFGGGPLASAAIAATAAVIEDEDLPGNARRVGGVLTRALGALDGVVGVTGRGLLLGVNLDRPAKPVVAAVRERRILTGTCGGDPNQMRLLPPLTLTEDEALSLVPVLEDVLRG